MFLMRPPVIGIDFLNKVKPVPKPVEFIKLIINKLKQK